MNVPPLLVQFPLTVIVPDVAFNVEPEEIVTLPLISQVPALLPELNVPAVIAKPPAVIAPPFVTKLPDVFVRIPEPILIDWPLPSVVVDDPEATLRLYDPLTPLLKLMELLVVANALFPVKVTAPV